MPQINPRIEVIGVGGACRLYDLLGALEQHQDGGSDVVIGYRHHVVNKGVDVLHGLGARALDGDAVRNRVHGIACKDAVLMEGVDDCRCTFCLYADDLNARVDLLDAGSHTGQQAAAARRNQNHIDSRLVAQDFHADGALTCHDVLVIKRMNKGRAGFLYDFHCLGIGVIVARAGQHDIRAVALGRGYLGNRGGTRHTNGSRNADLSCGKRNALRVVACGRSNDRLESACLVQLHDFVICTAHLEGAGFLLVFALQKDFCAGHAGEGCRRGERNIVNDRLQTLRGFVDVFDGNHW